MKTQVAIIGAGPSGLLLSELLAQQGITNIVIDKHARLEILARIRAGVLEPRSVDILTQHGLAQHLLKKGTLHRGFNITWANSETMFIDVAQHTERYLTTYGQAQLQEDLYLAADARNAEIFHQVSDVELLAVDSSQPQLKFLYANETKILNCDFIIGCDGFHGVGKNFLSKQANSIFSKTYPFSWLGVLAATPPLNQITYSLQSRGFALASMRNAQLSRYYIQVPNDTKLKQWSEEAFWLELKARFSEYFANEIHPAQFIEKSLAKIRAFLINPIQFGRLFLVGDAAHLLPPTGAKGLNLAIADAKHLADALIKFYKIDDEYELLNYSKEALRRTELAFQIADYLTNLLHIFPAKTNLQEQYRRLSALKNSLAHQVWLAQRYIGVVGPGVTSRFSRGD